MANLLGILLFIGLSFAWFVPMIQKNKNVGNISGKQFFKIMLSCGLPATLLIILTEIFWDRLFALTGIEGLLKDVISSFFRAALLEEFFKFRGFKQAIKKFSPSTKMDYMLSAGAVGLTYGLIEKLVLGNSIMIIISAILPGHIVWQINQGASYYDLCKEKTSGNKESIHHYQFMVGPAIFLMHGIWDCFIDSGAYLLNGEDALSQSLGLILILITIAGMVVYEIKTIKLIKAEIKLIKDNDNIE